MLLLHFYAAFGFKKELTRTFEIYYAARDNLRKHAYRCEQLYVTTNYPSYKGSHPRRVGPSSRQVN